MCYTTSRYLLSDAGCAIWEGGLGNPSGGLLSEWLSSEVYSSIAYINILCSSFFSFYKLVDRWSLDLNQEKG